MDKPDKPADDTYHREPFTTDVSKGKNDPIYNAHSYHTKVPHKAIMRYILHYTEPGDIVFEGFCGTGITGMAAQMCGDRKVVMSLGFQVMPDGTILQEVTDLIERIIIAVPQNSYCSSRSRFVTSHFLCWFFIIPKLTSVLST